MLARVHGTIAYRIWGGATARHGTWLTPIRPMSRRAARGTLSLPPGNSAEFVSVVRIPEGVRLQFGTAAAAFGQPGRGPQIQLLERIPMHMFGPGMPLPPGEG